jgi:hypothetical protein
VTNKWLVVLSQAIATTTKWLVTRDVAVAPLSPAARDRNVSTSRLLMVGQDAVLRIVPKNR